MVVSLMLVLNIVDRDSTDSADLAKMKHLSIGGVR